MMTQRHLYGNALATVYYLDAGENIGRHNHPVTHTTCVLVGRSHVDVFSTPPQSFDMTLTDADFTLPAFVDHDITALQDGTVVLNVVLVDAAAAPPPPSTQAGVSLVCGDTAPTPAPVVVVTTP